MPHCHRQTCQHSDHEDVSRPCQVTLGMTCRDESPHDPRILTSRSTQHRRPPNLNAQIPINTVGPSRRLRVPDDSPTALSPFSTTSHAIGIFATHISPHTLDAVSFPRNVCAAVWPIGRVDIHANTANTLTRARTHHASQGLFPLKGRGNNTAGDIVTSRYDMNTVRLFPSVRPSTGTSTHPSLCGVAAVSAL